MSEDARRTYDGPERIGLADGQVVTEVVKTGDFEAHLAWAVGLADDAPYVVSMLDNPLRLVVDVHDS